MVGAMFVGDLPTPALIVDLETLRHNIDAMAAVRPGVSLRAHVKAHKSTELARYAIERSGSAPLCVATLREAHGIISAGLGHDVLVANETLHGHALSALVAHAADHDSPLTIAVDSLETIEVAAAARRHGPLAVLIDVNVGLPRCGVAPAEAGALAESARKTGLRVRGVMGYEGHVVGNPDRAWRVDQVNTAMALLRSAHDDVGGEITSAGGTGTFDLHDWANEVQAGSYLLMDTAYRALDLPFRQAATVLATVISANARDNYVVADAGLKAFGMDHGEPSPIGHTMFFCSDEHATIVPGPSTPLGIGDRVDLIPAHIDPTLALHERLFVIERRAEDGSVPLDAEVVDEWAIDLRGW